MPVKLIPPDLLRQLTFLSAIQCVTHNVAVIQLFIIFYVAPTNPSRQFKTILWNKQWFISFHLFSALFYVKHAWYNCFQSHGFRVKYCFSEPKEQQAIRPWLSPYFTRPVWLAGVWRPFNASLSRQFNDCIYKMDSLLADCARWIKRSVCVWWISRGEDGCQGNTSSGRSDAFLFNRLLKVIMWWSGCSSSGSIKHLALTGHCRLGATNTLLFFPWVVWWIELHRWCSRI